MKKILIDVFGSDHPEQLLEGCARCTLEVPDVMLVLPGEEAMLRAELEKYPCNWDALEFMPASEIITNHDDPIDAVMHKRDSTLVKGMQRLKRDPELAGMLTAGSTGAALAGGVAYAGRIRGVRTPALATFLPSVPGRRLCLADCGANVDCKPERMEQFALMATALMQSCGVEEPRVGLLSVGVEESKGSHFIREVYDLLEQLPIRFTGMMEARDALSGEYDVIVAEGFSGNVLLKTMEGVGSFAGSALKAMFKKNLLTKLAALCVMPGLNAFKAKLDPNKVGGTAFIGISRPVIKAHGSSNAEAIENAMGQAMQVARSGIIRDIEENVALMKVERE